MSAAKDQSIFNQLQTLNGFVDKLFNLDQRREHENVRLQESLSTMIRREIAQTEANVWNTIRQERVQNRAYVQSWLQSQGKAEDYNMGSSQTEHSVTGDTVVPSAPVEETQVLMTNLTPVDDDPAPEKSVAGDIIIPSAPAPDPENGAERETVQDQEVGNTVQEHISVSSSPVEGVGAERADMHQPDAEDSATTAAGLPSHLLSSISERPRVSLSPRPRSKSLPQLPAKEDEEAQKEDIKKLKAKGKTVDDSVL
jgi:hypothetical protein